MRKIREGCYNAGARRYLVNKRKFTGALRLRGGPFHEARGDAGGGSEKGLSGQTRGDHKEWNRVPKPAWDATRARDAHHALREGHPKQGDKWRGVVEVNLPLGRTPGEKM